MKKIVATYLLLLSALFIAPASIAQTISINTVSLSGKIYRGIDNPVEITCDSCPEDVSFSLTAENAEVVQDDSIKTKYTVTTYWKQDLEDDVILRVCADIGGESKSVRKKFDLVAIHDPVSEVTVSGHKLYEQDTCMVLTKNAAMYAMVHNVLIELPDGSIRSLPKTICIYTLSL